MYIHMCDLNKDIVENIFHVIKTQNANKNNKD